MDITSSGKRKKNDNVGTKKIKSHKKKKTEKLKKSEPVEDEVDSVGQDASEIETTEKSTAKKIKVTKSNDKPKKIVFIDDEPHEVSDSTTSKTVKGNKKKKKSLNDEEEDVKDEDIDKFCDEIDDEDNKQYEDWVKQIEATLNSNKKKS